MIKFIFLFILNYTSLIYPQLLPFHHYTMRDGLISDNIHTICQDSSGYIWIGTGEGLSVFNSKIFRNYTTSDGLISNNISVVIPDRSVRDKIWIGTNGKGVEVFENGKFTSIGKTHNENQNYIYALFQVNDSTIFCGSEGGIFIIKNSRIQFPDNKTISGPVYSFAKRDSSICIGSAHGLYKTSENLQKILEISPDNKNEVFSSVLCDKEKNIWAFASNTGLMYRINRDDSIKIYNFHLKNFSTGIIEDVNNNIWISANNGLYKFNKNDAKNTFTGFTKDNGLLQNDISSILFDKENILWITTNDNGMSKLIDTDLYQFQDKNYYSVNWSTVSSDTNNHFWASVNNNLTELFPDKHKNWIKFLHRLPGEFQHSGIQKILCDKRDKVYVCSSSGEIQVYKIIPVPGEASILKKSEFIDLKKISKGNKLYTIMVDNLGKLWCSILDKGIILLDNQIHNRIKELYTSEDGIPDNSVRAIYQDSKGNFWFGGFDHGLSEFSNSGNRPNRSLSFIKHFTVNDGLPDNDIRAITERESGIIIGTRYGGIAILKSRKFKLISKKNGLFSDAIWSIALTPEKIWLGTQAGIQSLNSSFNISNELYEDIPRIPFYSISSSENGNLCFASSSDFYIYEQPNQTSGEYHPPVYLSHFLVNGREKKLEENMSLTSNENTITFEFQGIMNKNENEIKYEYRLINKNDSWKLLTNSNVVTYSMLNPGIYTFQVAAVNIDNVKSIVPAELTFKIKSPFYEMWWFYLLCILTIVLLIYIMIRIKLNRIIEIEKIRTRIASDLHDEIGSGLTHIAMLSENSLISTSDKNSEENKFSTIKSVERIGKISRDLVDSMIDVIWAIDPAFDSLNDFINNFKSYAYEICEAKNIKLNIETANIAKLKVTPQVKRSLQLISKEALNNAFKYSDCTEIHYHLSVKNKVIVLTIEDNGKGFEMNNVKYGKGIMNMQKNVNELNGGIEIKTACGKGTGIYIKFPVNN